MASVANEAGRAAPQVVVCANFTLGFLKIYGKPAPNSRGYTIFSLEVSKSRGIREICVHGGHYDTILERKTIPIGMSQIVS